MPNGRSGGFLISPEQLDALIREVDSGVVVGTLDGHPVTAAQLWTAVGQWDRPQVHVEEQNHKSYIVHLTSWTVVDGKSPLFERFRHAEAQWRREIIKGDAPQQQ
jgi:hypothetical protein